MSFKVKTFAEIADSGGSSSGGSMLVDRVINNLRLLDPDGGRYLLTRRGVPQYRYCPVCLASDRIKFFRIEWRFRCWFWCPLHRCCLLDACPTCKAAIQLPYDLISAGKSRSGVASLHHCLRCEADLTADARRLEGALSSSALTEWELCQMRFGRAVLATLLYGRFTLRTENFSVEKSVRELRGLERQGLIPMYCRVPEVV